MEIRRVEGSDLDEFTRFHRLLEEIRAADSDYPATMGLDEARVLFVGPHTDMRHSGLAAVDGEEWLGVAVLDEDLLENTDVLGVEIHVAPAYRRRGIGSRLLSAAEDHAQDRRRTSLLSELHAPYRAGQPTSSAGTAFAEHHGFVRKHQELHQVLDLPVEEAELDRIAARIAPQHSDYRLVQWGSECPDEWIDQFCELLSLMGTEVPMGDLELEPTVWTPERLRRAEDRRRRQGRFSSTTVAVDADGTLVAFTQLGGVVTQPERLFQWDTLVRPEHRGRRLGMAVKIPNLRVLQAQAPTPAVVHTWNAPENAPMIAVNDALGFRPVEMLNEYQRDL